MSLYTKAITNRISTYCVKEKRIKKPILNKNYRQKDKKLRADMDGLFIKILCEPNNFSLYLNTYFI